MVSVKGISRGESGEEEKAWKVGTEANVTGRQLNPGLPSKGCMFVLPARSEGVSVCTERFQVNASSSDMSSFFVLSFPPIFGSLLYAHRSLCGGKREGARESGRKEGRLTKAGNFSQQ